MAKKTQVKELEKRLQEADRHDSWLLCRQLALSEGSSESVSVTVGVESPRPPDEERNKDSKGSNT